MKNIAIYLAGSIKKAHEKASDESYWTDEEMNLIRTYLNAFEVSFLNPAFRTDDLSDQRSVFGRDMTQVYCADFVFVDARDRRGLGVGAEMMWAKCNRIPVLSWVPKNSHYHKSRTTILGVTVDQWVHPFVESLSDYLAEDLQAGARWIERALTENIPIKGIETIESAMHYYRDRQFHHDKPMRSIIESSESLNRKMQDLRVTSRL